MTLFPDIKRIRAKAEEDISALPGLVMHAQRIAANIMHGEHIQRKSGSGETFRQFRPYHESDRPQDIDWRQSGKHDQVFVKQKELQSTIKTFLWCADSASMRYSSATDILSKQDSANILTLALALLTRRAKEPVGLIGDMKTGRSDAHIHHIAQDLIHQGRVEDVLPHIDGASLPRDAAFYGIGDYLSPIEEIEQHFALLASKTENALIIQVLDPCEITLNYSGRVRFNDGEDHDFVVNHVPSIQQAYKERMEEHIERIRTLCSGYSWAYALHQTDHDLSDSLRQIWSLTSNKGR